MKDETWIVSSKNSESGWKFNIKSLLIYSPLKVPIPIPSEDKIGPCCTLTSVPSCIDVTVWSAFVDPTLISTTAYRRVLQSEFNGKNCFRIYKWRGS